MIRSGLVFSLAILAGMVAIAIWATGQLPADNIPVHWGIDGTADRYSDRTEATFLLWMMPAAAAFTACVLAVMIKISPMRDNLLRGSKAYMATWYTTMILLFMVQAGIAWSMVQSASSDYDSTPMVRMIMAGVSVMIIVIGNYLPKTRLNFIIGIKTPWTLTSDYTWEKTHKLAGKLMMIAGILSLAGALFAQGIWLVIVMSGSIMMAAMISAIYSYFVWRGAPDKRESPDYIV